MTRIPVGVIGVGHLGSLHAKMFAGLPLAEFVGVTDTDASRAASVAHDHGVEAFANADELLSRVKAVSIATPTVAHFEVAQNAIARGIHVFIEKPITTTVAEAASLVSLARTHGVILQVGHIERFNPAVLALESYILRPMFVESHRLAQFNPRGTDVAVVLDLMIHDIDIIMSLVKSPVEQIEANGLPVVSETIDIANARLQFANGCVANVTASRISQKKMRKMRLFQRDAYISIDFSDGKAEVFRLLDSGDPLAASMMSLGEIDLGGRKRKIVFEQPQIGEINALRHELEMFLHSSETGEPPVVTGEDGMAALEVAQEIMNKINQQKMAL